MELYTNAIADKAMLNRPTARAPKIGGEIDALYFAIYRRVLCRSPFNEKGVMLETQIAS